MYLVPKHSYDTVGKRTKFNFKCLFGWSHDFNMKRDLDEIFLHFFLGVYAMIFENFVYILHK